MFVRKRTVSQACVEELDALHSQWLELINTFQISPGDLSSEEVAEVMDLFRTIKYHYQMFGSMCDVPDSRLVAESTLEDLRATLKTRKVTIFWLFAAESAGCIHFASFRCLVASPAQPATLQKLFQRLRANYLRMMTLVSRVPNLVPEMEKVISNINALNDSVQNLENFYDLYCVREKVADLGSDVKELDSFVGGAALDPASNLNDTLVARIREVDEELANCQERMNSLETVCNSILVKINELSAADRDQDDDALCCRRFVRDFKEMQRNLQTIKLRWVGGARCATGRFRLDALLRLCPAYEPRSQQHDDSYSDSSLPEAQLRRRRTPLGAPAAVRAAEPAPARPTGQSRPWARSGVTLSLLLLGLGLLLLGLLADPEVRSRSGHWSFRFGPQLRYVQGPPPM